MARTLSIDVSTAVEDAAQADINNQVAAAAAMGTKFTPPTINDYLIDRIVHQVFDRLSATYQEFQQAGRISKLLAADPTTLAKVDSALSSVTVATRVK